MTTERLIFGLFVALLICLAAYNSRHLVLPDAIVIPAIIIGLVLSWFVPSLHGKSSSLPAVREAVLGLLAGSLAVYGLSVVGKTLFGKHVLALPTSSRVVMNQTALILPDRAIPYEEIFYRNSDRLEMRARTVSVTSIQSESPRILENVLVALSPTKLTVGDMTFDPSQIAQIEVTADSISFPREAVGFGLVKFAALIGVFLGWQGVLFAVGCAGAALALATLLALKLNWADGQRIDAATPMCIASVVWLALRTKLILAGGLAIFVGITITLVLQLLSKSNDL